MLCPPRNSVSRCSLQGRANVHSLRPVRHSLHVPALADRTAGALSRRGEWLVVPRSDRLETQHASAPTGNAPQPYAFDAERPQVSHSRRCGGLRGFRRPQHTSAMTQRDHPARPSLYGGLVGSDSDGGVLNDRHGLVDLVALPDLNLERVFDLAAHRARRSAFAFCSQYAKRAADVRLPLGSAKAKMTTESQLRVDWQTRMLAVPGERQEPPPLRRRECRSHYAQRRRGYVDRHALFITCRSCLTPSPQHGAVKTTHRIAPNSDSWQQRACVWPLVPVAECRDFAAPFDGLFHIMAGGLVPEEVPHSERSAATATLCRWAYVTRFTGRKLLGFKKIRPRNDHQSR